MGKKTLLVLICFTGILIIFSITKGSQLVKENGCTDLLCRTIGSRLFHDKKSAYFFKWSNTDSTYFLNPNDPPDLKVNGNVVTPAVLKLSYGMAQFPYRLVKYIWITSQYLFLFATIFFLAYKNKTARENISYPVFAVLALYLVSNIWFYNVERGQIYTFYLFILSLIYFLYQNAGKYGEFAAGFINGFAIFLRPLLLFFIIPFLLRKKMKVFAGNCFGFIAGFCFFVMPSVQQWKDYSSAMKEYSTAVIEKKHVFTANKIKLPGVEGFATMQKAQHFSCGGLNTIQFYFSSKGILLNSLALVFIYLLLASVCCLLYLKRGPAFPATDNDFLFAFLLYMLSELFVVGVRGGYNQLEWVFAIFLILKKNKLPPAIFVALTGALILENVKIFEAAYWFGLAEAILFIIASFSALTINPNSKNDSHSLSGADPVDNK